MSTDTMTAARSFEGVSLGMGHRGADGATTRTHCKLPIRMLRLSQVREMTGLGKTKIYELQAQGDFPMRIKMTARSVAWIEEEVQAWLALRIESNPVSSKT